MHSRGGSSSFLLHYDAHRFHVERMDLPSATSASPHFPNLTTSQDWYRLKAFVEHKSGEAMPESNAAEEISVSAHAKALKRMYSVLGTDFSKFTHLGKTISERVPKLKRAKNGQIIYEGKCRRIDNLPMPTMRQLAGCDSAQDKNFVPRLQIKVPETLARQIFPEADVW